MKSLERNFGKVRNLSPGYSDYACFAAVIRGQHFSKRTIIGWFNRLVDKDDYAPGEKKEILQHLYEIDEA